MMSDDVIMVSQFTSPAEAKGMGAGPPYVSMSLYELERRQVDLEPPMGSSLLVRLKVSTLRV